MDRIKLERLRGLVSCEGVLLQAGFVLDEKESSRRARKFRRSPEILIVTHEGAGWFDPLSDHKGDVFALAGFLEGISFPAAVERICELAGRNTPSFVPRHSPDRPVATAPVLERWQNRPLMTPVSPGFRYLTEARALPGPILRRAIRADRIRQGPFASAWFRHDDDAGNVSGWEERGPDWRGFSTGGTKTLFCFGARNAPRVCITEAAIDALSLAALEGARGDTLYASTGGGWAPAVAHHIEAITTGRMLVAATDADPQGEVYADRLRNIADHLGCDFVRLRPHAQDWNEELRAQ
ncbi:DUF3991 and toprim domain-containing protein [Rhizobium sp. BE258]|uniref:DUF3991 and toprim domain-containing protein n=1 Tax=Rhizobium sp. BE258 TaxID=2817722 RepID=UPI00286797B8|nr:DUF3991 and toprim domain-containing protein [Rhizobium sp. BE258]MDR7147809.1 hypothetical protein [Rhizobium sp. BE258]